MDNNMTYKVAKSRNKNLNVAVIIVFTILLVYTLFLIFMLCWGFMTSFKSYRDFQTDGNVLGLPNLERWNTKKGEHLFYNYQTVIENFELTQNAYYYTGLNLDTLVKAKSTTGILGTVWNSFLYAFVGSVIIAFVPAVVGYVCAKYPYRWSTVMYSIVITVMVLPIVGTTPARITLMRRLGIFNEIWGDWIVCLTFTNMYFLVFYAFFQGMSGTYAEAAEVDGASQFRTMVNICMPLASKMIVTIILIFFISRWNDYNTPLLMMPTKPTIAYAIYDLVTLSTNAGHLKAPPAQIAACMFLAIPMLILFVCLKDKLMGNLSMGGIKE